MLSRFYRRKDSVLALAGSDGAVTFLRVSQTLLSTVSKVIGSGRICGTPVLFSYSIRERVKARMKGL